MVTEPSDTTVQVCMTCGARLPERDPRTRCPCGGLLDLVHPAPRHTGAALRRVFTARLDVRAGAPASGVWRYRELVLPSAGLDVVSHPEGNTPVLEREGISRWAGHPELQLKHEGLNPTGSFKDRGVTVGITQARRIGARAVACASTGNTAASLAAYVAQAILPCVVLIPAGFVAAGKLAQALAYGAKLVRVRGGFDQCLELIDREALASNLYLLNSINPFRIEGQKTIVFELLHQLDWSPPDWIVVPAGNLGNTAAFGKALGDARQAGLISTIPRLAAIQAEGAAPFARSFEEGFARRASVSPDTVATAIRIGNPASYARAVRAIRSTDGVVTTVSDAEILEAKAVIDGAGVGAEPASAASVAGVRRLIRDGIIDPEDRVVAVLTGHLLKDPDILRDDHGRRGATVPEIDAEPDAVARVLEQLTEPTDGGKRA